MKTKARIIMKTKARIILFGLVMVIPLCYTNFVRAESDFATGAGANAVVNLDFQIVIPRFVYFRVGQTGAGINQIDFAPTVDELTTEAVTTGAGGDIGSGTVTVALISNGGSVTITPSNNSGGNGLSDGLLTPNFISYAQINSASNDPAGLPAPALTNAGGTPVNIAVNFGTAVTNRSAQWTYTYTNPANPPAAGTYGGSANGGQVTYTAAIP